MLNQPGLFTAAAEACPSLHQDLVLVDLETTGASAARDRVIEIGLLHVRGLKVVAEWSSLVNPGLRLSPFIRDYTGISDAMVAAAPPFADIAEALQDFLARGLMVAHNARFDYGFLQQEFARTGHDYRAPRLCTVKLSRRLFPAERRHNLDALIRRFELTCRNRHRALGDAGVLFDFLRQLPDSCTAAAIEQAFDAQSARGRQLR